MSEREHIAVAVERDFVARQTTARPVPALAELIWNSLDADATEVNVELIRDSLAQDLSKIVIYDNGDGFSRQDAKHLFGRLGGSWKRQTRHTRREQRMVHGQEGRGRYKAFALGASAEWNVCYDDGERRNAFTILLIDNDLTDVSISPDIDAGQRNTGTIVSIETLHRDFRSLDSAEGVQELAEIFALYLQNYRHVKISVNGERLNPDRAIATQREVELSPTEIGDERFENKLLIVEWRSDTKRTLYLCSLSGLPLEQVETRFHVPGFSFSAYLNSRYIERLHDEDRLALAEMDLDLARSVEGARVAIKDYFRQRAAERAQTVVDEWKASEVYPFSGTPATTVEKAERQVFDIVAAHVQEIAPEISEGSPRARALHLRMLKNAIERGPEELQTILHEVLDLAPRQQKEFAALLQETTLASIITAAKTVADRLKFITALENIVFDPGMKSRLKERSQLHKILAENTWVFGEEYNLWVSDQGLKRVLAKHRTHLDPAIRIDEPVKVIDKERGIVDLMFSRSSRRHRATDVENMIVELKAPKVKIGAKEVVQAKTYAQAVAVDERFHSVPGVKWHFWLVSNEYDDYARAEIEGGVDPDRRLISRFRNVSVGIKSWGELIEENRARLQFFQERLQHTADDSVAIRHLHEKHSKFLDGVIVEAHESVAASILD